MQCPKCGREIPYGTVCSCSANTPLSSNPAVNVLKTIGSSPLFLTAAVLYSVATLISVFTSIMGNSGISDYLLYALYNADIDYSVLYPMVSALNGASVGMTLLFSVPTILIAVGMWLFFCHLPGQKNRKYFHNGPHDLQGDLHYFSGVLLHFGRFDPVCLDHGAGRRQRLFFLQL